MLYANFALAILLPVTLSVGNALPTHLGGLKGVAAAYPDCGPDHLGAADLIQLKRDIVKAVAPRDPPDPIGQFFKSNVVIVALAQLHKGERSLIAYLSGEGYCGTSGCNGYVLDRVSGPGQSNYTLITEIEPARVPISVLPSMHSGWHDIGVVAAGGSNKSIPGYIGALAYDGSAYQSNPTLDGIRKVDEGSGRIVLGPPGAAPGQCRLR